ncbi:RsmB/NOP family class I SAM-dependent RNA methyltransferase [Nibricoccus sp. IMCC34717]|uniref:RsmB/NOP family class I SAM-dependent RNA methyltransferase n=1 Tax=Nibricoccus sp. IMCC34717 TaxID=3034021 RepID=UPI00384DCBC3
MTPSRDAARARIFATLLGELRAHWETDRNLPERLRRLLADRRFGSRDRRVYREWGYTALRHALRIGPLFDRSREEAVAAVIAAATASDVDLPPEACVPAWFLKEAPAACTSEGLRTLMTRPPVWLRARRPVAEVAAALANERIETAASPVLPAALRVLGEHNLEGTQALRDGLFEIQDIGSQRVLASLQPTGLWLDACAGAGGKTIQLADLGDDSLLLQAWEPRASAREELQRRAARAGLRRLTILPSPPAKPGSYDGILVDAPCSGSGTWRRSPHLKLCTTEAAIQAAAARQLEILASYAPLVRPGGQLVYATCSLCQTENERVIETFLAEHPQFTAVAAETLLPQAHDGDGFFTARVFRNA